MNRFAFERVVGRGRLSVVYLAEGRRADCRVAVKVARRADLRRLGRGGDFAREFEAAVAVAPPLGARMFEHGVDGVDAFLAMEFMPGGAVARPAARDVFARALQAADALAALHGTGWVHRDVKAANLLLRQDGSLVLADFGTACRIGHVEDSPAGSVIGTPRYAAPEQGAPCPAHPAADVYALGAVMYEWLCGRPAFPGETATELRAQHLLAQPAPLSAAQAAWQSLLDALLAKDPARRPAHGAALAARLRALAPHLERLP